MHEIKNADEDVENGAFVHISWEQISKLSFENSRRYVEIQICSSSPSIRNAHEEMKINMLKRHLEFHRYFNTILSTKDMKSTQVSIVDDWKMWFIHKNMLLSQCCCTNVDRLEDIMIWNESGPSDIYWISNSHVKGNNLISWLEKQHRHKNLSYFQPGVVVLLVLGRWRQYISWVM